MIRNRFSLFFSGDKSFGVVNSENNQTENSKSLTELTTVRHSSQEIANTSGPEPCDPEKSATTQQNRTDESLNNRNVPDERQGGSEIVALETPASAAGPAKKSVSFCLQYLLHRRNLTV